MRNAAGAVLGGPVHKPRKIGGGGFVTGLGISNDGQTKVCGMDVFNAYKFVAGDTQWRELFTAISLPTGEWTITAGANADGTGCYAIKVAPSDKTRIYATYNGRWYVSSNTGATFTRSSMAYRRLLANTGAQRLWNNKMAIDPQNPNVAMLGTMGDGIYVTTDALATEPAALTGIAAGATAGGIQTPHLVACDPNSAVLGGIKQTWYVTCYGTGVYVSTTGPLGSYLLMIGSPPNVTQMICDAAGNLWCLDTTGSKNVFKWNGAAWAQITTMAAAQVSAIAVEPGNTNNVVLTTVDGFLQRSTDACATWIGGAGAQWFDTFPSPIGREIIADQIPWLGASPGLGFPSDILFDPSQSNKLFMSHGLGVCFSTPPATFVKWTWTDITHGIEELVGNFVLNPPGGATLSPIFCTMDKKMWVDPDLDAFPSTIRGPTGSGLSHSWAADYAIGDPNFVVSITNFQDQRMSYSSDRGLSWTKFSQQHPDGNLLGGCVAVGARGGSGGVNVIWIPGNNGKALYRKSTDLLTDPWRYLPFPGYPSGFGNWVNAFYVRRYVVTADKTQPGTFYLVVNSITQPVGSPDASFWGVWKTTDEGDTWTRVYANKLDTEGGSFDFWHGILACVPGRTGELYYTPGRDYAAGRLKYSSDAGATFNAVANVFGCRNFGFGKAAPGSAYPTIFVEATISGTYGIFMSTDNCATWIQLSTYPLNRIDNINGLFGDPNIFGRYYIAYSGSGFIYGDFVHTGTIS